MKKEGILYIVATPIGNLKDITLRALDVLKNVDLIACEDTRVTKKLLNKYQITTPTISFHQHSADKKIEDIVKRLDRGGQIAYVSDSGTPGVSDPGNKLIQEASKYDTIKTVPIPGPSSLPCTLSVSGVSSKNILFLGFLPHKKGRQTLLHEIKNEIGKNRTVVFYESPYRIAKTINQLKEIIPKARIVIARELTKKFEEIIRSDLWKLNTDRIKTKGEFTIVVYSKF